MARYLYRLGLFSVRRAWTVIAAWALLLAVLAAGAVTLGKPFSSDITIPGTEFQNVIDDLQKSLPSTARGSGTVVFTTEEGAAFTPVQRQAIKSTLDDWATIDGVRKASNPFTTQKDLDKGRTKVADAKQDLADGEKTIKKNQKKITDGRKDIKKGKKTLDANAAKISSGTEQLAAGQAKLAAGQQTIDANRAKLDGGTAELAAGQAKLATGRTQIAKARAQLNTAQAQLTAGKEGLEKGRTARTQIDQAQQQLDAATAKVDALAAEKGDDDPEVVEQRAALKEQQDKLDASAKLVPSAAELDKAEKTLATNQAKVTKGFATLEANAAKLDAGEEKLASAGTKLADGKAQLEAGQAELNSGKSEIDLNQIKLASGADQIAQARVQLAAAEEKLDDGQKKLDKAKVKLADGKVDLVRGERRLDLMDGFRAVSEDGTTAVSTITFDTPGSAVAAETKEAIPTRADALAKAGVRVDYSSDLLPTAETSAATEAVGVAVAAIVLFVMLGSLLAAGLPLLIAIISVGTGLLAVLTVTHWVSMTSVTPVLALMLGLAVGIDYALFLVHRHRQQLAQGVELRESIARANATAGGAVLFAGLTVVVALAALTVTGIPFLTIMGLAGAATVAAAILVNLTLTPALLRLIGPRVLSPAGRRKLAAKAALADAKAAAAASTSAATKARRKADGGWSRLVTRHPLLTIALTVVVLGLMAVPAASLKLGLPDASSESHDSTTYQAYTKISSAFGPGQNAAMIAVAKVDKNEARRLTKDAATDLQLTIAEDLKDTPDVAYVVPASISKDRRTMVFQIVPSSGPNDDATSTLVHQLRSDRAQIVDKTVVESVGFAGQTVANIDISQRLSQALPTYLGVVVGISLVLLLLVFRSLVVPLLATGGFLLSSAAALGGVVAVYQWGWLGSVFGVEQPGLILSFLPTLAIGILFGLAMDYQMFLVSGMREAWTHGQPARTAVRTGFSHGAKVVTAAALIMTAVFSSFIFADQAMIKPIGFVLAAGVLIDAFVIRMTLMPAFMHLLGEKAWYLPRWLDRALPDLDIEGTKLAAAPGHLAPDAEQPGPASQTGQRPTSSPATAAPEPEQPSSGEASGRSMFARPPGEPGEPATSGEPDAPDDTAGDDPAGRPDASSGDGAPRAAVDGRPGSAPAADDSSGTR